MCICSLLTGFIAICFPLWADLFQLSLISWSGKGQCSESKGCSLSVIPRGISMFLLLCYKTILLKFPKIPSYQKANVGVKRSGTDCMCNPSLLFTAVFIFLQALLIFPALPHAFFILIAWALLLYWIRFSIKWVHHFIAGFESWEDETGLWEKEVITFRELWQFLHCSRIVSKSTNRRVWLLMVLVMLRPICWLLRV